MNTMQSIETGITKLEGDPSKQELPKPKMKDSMQLVIPRATQDELAHPAAPGHRHEQATRIACSLSAQKLGDRPIAGFFEQWIDGQAQQHSR